MGLGWIGDLAGLAASVVGGIGAAKAQGDASDAAGRAQATSDKILNRQLDIADKDQLLRDRQVALMEDLQGRKIGISDQVPGTFDNEEYRKAMGIFAQLQGGTDPDRLMTFKPQFDQVDASMQKSLSGIDAEVRTGQQQIATNLTGGAKIRALANLTVAAQNKKGEVIKESRQKKRDLNVALKNEWLNKAVSFNEGIPREHQNALTTQANILTGIGPINTDVSGILGSAGGTASQNYLNATNDIKSASGKLYTAGAGAAQNLWNLSNKPSGSNYEYIPPTAIQRNTIAQTPGADSDIALMNNLRRYQQYNT